jgi:hypothetical protein
LVFALNQAWFLGQVEGNLAEVERCASDVIELSRRHNLSTVLPGAFILPGWARSVSGHTAEGITLIEEGIRDSHWAGGANVGMPYFLALKAEALHLADRTSEARYHWILSPLSVRMPSRSGEMRAFVPEEIQQQQQQQRSIRRC